MNRINRIINNQVFGECMNGIYKAEAERAFCRHDIAHLLDVARLAYIGCLEAGLDLSKEVIYAAALLHDIGRAAQYRDGASHDIAGAEIAAGILPECGYSNEECTQIVQAVSGHRGADEGTDELTVLIRKADHDSRCCFMCAAAAECKWSEERRNKELIS